VVKKDIEKLVDEIEKRTELSYDDEDSDGNLFPGSLYTVNELIDSLKKKEKDLNDCIKLLKKKVKQERLTGFLFEKKDIGSNGFKICNCRITADVFFLDCKDVVIHSNIVNGKIFGN